VNLFYGTGIPACIVVIDKEGAQSRKGIFMVDASNGFIKDGPKNRLREQDIHKIVDAFNKEIELPRFSRMVSLDEIEKKNEFNLNLSRYIDSQTLEDLEDIRGHLEGGIPQMMSRRSNATGKSALTSASRYLSSDVPAISTLLSKKHPSNPLSTTTLSSWPIFGA